MRAPLRRLWLRIHRWIGLTLGPVLALTALLGAVLVVALPLDRYANPILFTARSAVDATTVALPLEPLRQRLAAEFGPDANFTLRPPRQATDTLWVLVRGKWEGTLYLDPATGAEQGRRGTHEGAYNLLFELHSSLLLDDTGKAILAFVALAYLFLLVTGLVLWWPARWPPSLRIVLDRGLLRGLFDLHRTGGAVFGLLIAVSVATGAYMAWRPLGASSPARWASSRSRRRPSQRARPAARACRSTISWPARSRPSRPADRLHPGPRKGRPADARALPATGRSPSQRHRLGVAEPDDRRRAGRAQVAGPRYRQRRGGGDLSTAHRRTGGLLHETLTVVLGLSLGGLGLSGVWLWWRRRAERRLQAQKTIHSTT